LVDKIIAQKQKGEDTKAHKRRRTKIN